MTADEDLLRRIAALEERVRRLEGADAPPQVVSSPEPIEDPQPPVAEPEPAPVATSPEPAPGGRNWEALIGGSVLNRIGIAAVLVGAAYFLRHAFEHDWIGPGMRVAIGIGVGVALLLWARRFHRRGAILFAHSIDVISVGVFYLSIWSASQLYGLVSTGVAFTGMGFVTATIVVLALRHDSEFLAGLAMTAGFLTPVLLATVDQGPIPLFSYVLLLDGAALILLALRPWPRLFGVNFFGTHLLYVGWHLSSYSIDDLRIAIGFTTIFFVLFAVVPLVRRWGVIPPLTAVLLSLLSLANAFAYFAQLSVLLVDRDDALVAGTAALGLAFLVLFFLLRRRLTPENGSFAGLHLGISLGFFLLTIPLHFDGPVVTTSWLVMSAILFALHGRRPHLAVSAAASVALALAVLRLLFIDQFSTSLVLLNQRAFGFALAIAQFLWLARVARHRSDRSLRNLALLMVNLLAIVGLTREASALFAGRTLARDFAYSAIWLSYATGMIIVGFRRSLSFIRWLALALLGFTILKVFLYDLAELEAIYRIVSFIALGVVLLAVSFVYQRLWLEGAGRS